jgi:chorismate dehydratase
MDSDCDVSAISGLRVGCVQYLNSRPLIYGLEGVGLAHPRVLASELREGRLDVALVPVVEWLRAPQAYVAVNGVAIASQGPVMSVFLAHQGRLEGIQAIVADPASLTSVHLVQVLARGLLGRRIPVLASEHEFVGAREQLSQLWIGNQALEHRLGSAGRGGAEVYWDLGEAWTRWTWLPFVYAVWVMREDVADPPAVADALRRVGKNGLRNLDEIVRKQTELPEDLAREYLRERIRFSLGDEEKRGLERFRKELERDGFLAGELGGIPLRWV